MINLDQYQGPRNWNKLGQIGQNFETDTRNIMVGSGKKKKKARELTVAARSQFQNVTVCHRTRMFSSCHCYSEWLEVPSWWWSTQSDIWGFAIKTQVPHAQLKITFDKWGIQGRAVTCCLGALVSRPMWFTMKANWQSRLSKVVYFHYNPLLAPNHTCGIHGNNI